MSAFLHSSVPSASKFAHRFLCCAFSRRGADPEGRKKLAGGEAKRNHRKISENAFAPEGRKQPGFASRSPFQGGFRVDDEVRWLRFASPPANSLSVLRAAARPNCRREAAYLRHLQSASS